MNKHYDKIILVFVVIVTVALAASWIPGYLGLNEKFQLDQKSSGKALFGEASADGIQETIDHLQRDVKWVTPTLKDVPQKPLPLTRSIPIWVQNDKEIDLLDPDAPKIRPPLDNSWALKNGDSVGRNDLLSLDQDNDGYTTLEEFNGGKTDPSDPESHPAYATKLTLSEIKEDTYALIFRTGDNPDGEFGVREEATRYEADPPRVPPRRKSHFLKMNTDFGTHPGHEDRYKITAFEKRTQPGGAGGIPVPAHLLTISDKTSGKEFKLEYKKSKLETIYYAVIDFQLPGSEAKLGPFKVGESFELSAEPGVKYEIIELDGALEKGVKLRKTGPSGASPQDITISAGEKNA
ncbi:hypothetical protein OAK04_01260 [Verrucomicrobia bacterium]|nr:hypothetical protein [Verrucomicrobiales bacterium]MDC0200995.1 hypothetical protein [Verrucomicrobiota bacterium]